MESNIYPNKKENSKKLLYDINNSDINIENIYCPHILNHFLNPFLNSKYEKINLSLLETNSQNSSSSSEQKQPEKDKKIIFSRNLSLLQNQLKSFNYYGYNQAKNLLNSFLIKNFSLDWILLNNPQNLSINSMNREGCIFSMNFNDTGNLMASSNHNHCIEIWDLKTKKLKKNISSHTEIVTGAQFFHGNEDNEYFLSCSLDKTIKLWKNYKNIHTFVEHSDWVRCISIREDNQQFLSGCVSSVVKLWDIPTQRVIGSVINKNEDPNVLTTVNSLSFMHRNHNLFIIGLRSGEVKIFDSRIQNKNNNFIKNIGLVKSFKAHNKKLNTAKLNESDKYILTSSRDSLLRLWDLRKLPKEDENEEDIKKNKNYLNEYNKHKCVGYNIECNFFNNEQYVLTGSENSHIYIYDILNSNLYYKIKTQQKCTNLVKQIPNTFSIAFTGLEDISIFIWNAHKNITKFYEKKYLTNDNKKFDNFLDDSDDEKDLDNLEETDKNHQLCNKLIEEIMAECGDMILKIFHNHNLTYSNGINFENLIEIIQKSKDEKSERLLKMINEKFMKRIMDNFISGVKNKKQGEEKKENKVQKKITQKRDIKCLKCQNNEKNKTKVRDNDKDNNIFNSVDREQLSQLLILPNNFGFNKRREKNEINIEKEVKVKES